MENNNIWSLEMSYKSKIQEKNLAWILPRPKPDHYQGGMPLHCEMWLLELARDLIEKKKTENPKSFLWNE